MALRRIFQSTATGEVLSKVLLLQFSRRAQADVGGHCYLLPRAVWDRQGESVHPRAGELLSTVGGDAHCGPRLR